MVYSKETTVADRLKMAFAERGIQAKVAAACGVTPQAVTGWLKGGGFDYAHMPTISKITGYNLLWLMTGEGHPTGEDPDIIELVENYRALKKDQKNAIRFAVLGMKQSP